MTAYKVKDFSLPVPMTLTDNLLTVIRIRGLDAHPGVDNAVEDIGQNIDEDKEGG